MVENAPVLAEFEHAASAARQLRRRCRRTENQRDAVADAARVICSASQTRNIAPPANVSVVVNANIEPGIGDEAVDALERDRDADRPGSVASNSVRTSV